VINEEELYEVREHVEELLEGHEVLQLKSADLSALDATPGQYTAVYAEFLWAQVPREQQDKFLKQLREKVGKDVLLVLLGEDYVDGESFPVARTDVHGNTYEFQMDDDGNRKEVMKNYPSDSWLRKRLGIAAREIRVLRSEYYWVVTGRLK
jgi:hypothetical protein